MNGGRGILFAHIDEPGLQRIQLARLIDQAQRFIAPRRIFIQHRREPLRGRRIAGINLQGLAIVCFRRGEIRESIHVPTFRVGAAFLRIQAQCVIQQPARIA